MALSSRSKLCVSPTLTPSAAASVAAAAAAKFQGNAAGVVGSRSSAPGSSGIGGDGQMGKTEISDAVTKVLKGFDWSLVPTATK